LGPSSHFIMSHDQGQTRDLRPLLNPRSIAIIGASSDLSKLSGRPLKYLLRHRYPGSIFPVNPGAREIAGLKCWASLEAIPEPVDLALILLPAAAVRDAVIQCIQKGIKSAILFSSGFAETGGPGRILQDQIRDLAKNDEILLCGPNSIGIVNFHERIAASFSGVLDLQELICGNVGFITQSGALGGSLLSLAQERGIGISFWIHSGNEAQLGFTDYLHFLIEAETTKVIIAYLEGLADSPAIRLLTERARRKRKPIILLKVGRSSTGQQAALFHTGLSAGEESAAAALVKKSAIIRVDDTDELLDMANGFSRVQSFQARKRLAILTTSGGAGVLVSDKCAEMGIAIPQIEGEVKETLKKIIPPYGSLLNPIDITAQGTFYAISQPEYLRRLLLPLLRIPDFDLVMFVITMVVGDDAVRLAQRIVEISSQTQKPIVVCWIAGDLARSAYRLLQSQSVPVFSNLGRCLKVIKAMMEWEGLRQRIGEHA